MSEKMTLKGFFDLHARYAVDIFATEKTESMYQRAVSYLVTIHRKYHLPTTRAQVMTIVSRAIDAAYPT